METTVDTLAKKIWDYMLMHQEVKHADAIFIFGASTDTRAADRGAELFLEGHADYIICSGGTGKESTHSKPEAEVFKEILMAKGVPEEKIITEPYASNTGENISLTKKKLAELGLSFTTFILVNKPYMERRTFAAFTKQWEGATFTVTSPKTTYEEYTTNSELKIKVLNLLVGDLIRIKEYPKLGFQIEQEIPDDVWVAGQELLKLGYDKYAKV